MSEFDFALLRSACDQADDAIYITDTSAVILYANEAVSRITGFPRDQLVGGRPSLFASGLTSKEYYARMWTTLLSGEVWREAITNCRRDGSLYECTQTLTPVRDGEANISAFVAVQRDMTRRSTVQYEMRAARSEVERALEENQTLLREITHRTKNDLELLRSMLSLQAATVTDMGAAAALGTAMERVSVMGRMYRVFHEGGADAPTSPCRILGDLAEYWRDALFSPSETVSLRCDDCVLPEQVVVSIGIITNEIITNTAKYARRGGDTLSVDIQVTFPERGVLKLIVADSGPGFPTRILDGSDRGLGLTMADSLAQQYRGSLILNNTPGDQGTPDGAAVTVILRGEWE